MSFVPHIRLQSPMDFLVSFRLIPSRLSVAVGKLVSFFSGEVLHFVEPITPTMLSTRWRLLARVLADSVQTVLDDHTH